jgi:signal recognition particle GTPase
MQRPAAVEQLQVLGKQNDIPVFNIVGASSLEICAKAKDEAKRLGRDVIVYDTSNGQTQGELYRFERVKKKIPQEQDIAGNDADARKAVAVEVKTRAGQTDFLFSDGRPEKKPSSESRDGVERYLKLWDRPGGKP